MLHILAILLQPTNTFRSVIRIKIFPSVEQSVVVSLHFEEFEIAIGIFGREDFLKVFNLAQLVLVTDQLPDIVPRQILEYNGQILVPRLYRVDLVLFRLLLKVQSRAVQFVIVRDRVVLLVRYTVTRNLLVFRYLVSSHVQHVFDQCTLRKNERRAQRRIIVLGVNHTHDTCDSIDVIINNLSSDV